MVRRHAEGNVEDVEAARESYAAGMAHDTPNAFVTSLGPQSRSASGLDLLEFTTAHALPEDDAVAVEKQRTVPDESENWELEEVGRGLANYNWAQIIKVRGLNRFVASFTISTKNITLIESFRLFA